MIAERERECVDKGERTADGGGGREEKREGFVSQVITD